MIEKSDKKVKKFKRKYELGNFDSLTTNRATSNISLSCAVLMELHLAEWTLKNLLTRCDRVIVDAALNTRRCCHLLKKSALCGL
jgi:hypothetical protein